MSSGGSTAFFLGDPYRRRSPQRAALSSKSSVEPSSVPWRKHQKTYSSVSLNTAYGRRHSLESLSGGSLRHATSGGRSLRWKFPPHPFIEKLSDVAHIHYDLVELGPIRVEVLPLGSDIDLDTSTSSINRRSYHHHYQHPHQQPTGLPVLHEHSIGSIQNSNHLSPGGVGIKDVRASSSPSSSSLKESNSRVGADVFQQQEDCATSPTGAKPSSTKISYTLRVHSNQQSWTIQRSLEDFVDFDKQLHRCVYHRHFSLLNELPPRANTALASPSSSSPSSPQPPATASAENTSPVEAIWTTLSRYMERFSDLAGSLITCFPVLKWLELDNRGNHLVAAEETQINTPAVAAAYVVQNYTASAGDELTLKVGDIVSVIDMPPASESVWWRGKLTILKAQYADVDGNGEEKQHNVGKFDGQMMAPGAHFTIQVGFFPSHCVQLFGNRMSGSLPGALRDNAMSSRPVFRRRGKWATLLRLFLANRPSRRLLKEAGILKERVFGCDLAEHLESSGVDVPVVLRSCAEVIETCGIVDGIYRGSGIVSNIQRLRNAFDENRVPNLLLQDVHCVASLLKMYFRELPNPLLTYQLYDRFVEAVDGFDSSMKILRLHDVVQQLPPPYFRTAEYLIKHLSRVGEHGHKTGMHYPNLALVWAPNLLRSKELENVKENTSAVLRNVSIQAIVVEYLIRYADMIFSRKMPTFSSPSGGGVKRRARPMSLACPSSYSSPSNLLNLEEAKRKLLECRSQKVPANVGLPDLSNRKCIDVNGGPQSLPPKYHTVIHLPGSKSKPVRSGLNNSGSAGGWRTLFQGRKASQESDEAGKSAKNGDERQSASPVISAPKLICPPDSTLAFDEADGNSRKRLRHVRSAENFQPTSNAKPSFVSLDSSIQQASARRSLRGPKGPLRNDLPPHARANWTCSTPSPMDGKATFVYPQRPAIPFDYSPTTANPRERASLKSCRTTDIDHALSVVVESSPAVFSLRYNDGVQETLPTASHASTSYFEATLLPIPASPVSEPPASLEDESDDGEWIKKLLESNFAPIDDSFPEAMDVSFGNSSAQERKAFSAPNSLRRPEEKKSGCSSAIDDQTTASMKRTISDVDGDPSTAPVAQIVTFSATQCINESIGSAQEMVASTSPKEPLKKQQSDSEENVLLAELRKSPPEESPSHDVLQNLFPELDKIYSSLEEIPTTVSIIEKEEDASSLTDLEVIEMNPDWTSPGVNAKNEGHVADILKAELEGSRKLVDVDPKNTVKESGLYRAKVKDASTSPVPQNSSSNATEKVVSPSVESEIRGLLATVNSPTSMVKPNVIGDQNSRSGMNEDNGPKFISFKEANAVFDRRETLQAVQSSRYDSEDEDSILLDSIYDNVEASNRPFTYEQKQEKPTPMPRVSKLKSSFNGSSLDSATMPYLDTAVQEMGQSATVAMVQKTISKPQRPIVLTVATGDCKHWSSSEESELANSPLFRKQQQHLFLPPPSQEAERNKSEPPCVESIATRLNFGDNLEAKKESAFAKSESHLHRTSSLAEERKSHQIIAPSPRSAFSPVPPKVGSHRESTSKVYGSSTISGTTSDLGLASKNSNQQPLQSILSSSTKKSPSFKSKNAHVYFV